MAWSRAYGGDDGAYGMVAVSDGYVMLGDTSSSIQSKGSEDFYLVKANLKGDPIWTKNFGGKAWDIGYSLAAVSDGFILGGTTQSFGSNSAGDMYLVKTDLNGDLLWQKNFGGAGTEYGYGVAAPGDGYLLVGKTDDSFGNTAADIYLVKTDLSGNTVWEKHYGSTKDYFGNTRNCEGHAVIVVTDGYVIIGNEWSGKLLLLKTDFDGNLLWMTNVGDLGGSMASGLSVILVSDGYIITGYGNDLTSTNDDIFLAKTDTGGNLVWKKYFGGKGFDHAHAVVALPDGYAITGSTSSFSDSDDWDIYLLRTDREGNMVWNTTYGKAGMDVGHAIVPVDGGYVIAGRGDSLGYGACLIKTNSESSPNAPPATPAPTAGVSPSATGKPSSTAVPGVTKAPATSTAPAPAMVWGKALGGTDFEWGNSLVAVSDGFVIAGTASPQENTSLKVFMVKADRNGNMIWNKSYSITGGDRGYSIAAVSDGFVIMGKSNVTQGVFGGGYLLNTDFNGNRLWSKTYASDAGWDDVAGGIAVSDGFVLVGDTELWGQLPLDHNTNKYERTLLLMKADRNGNLVWLKEIGGMYPLRGLAIVATSDGYVATGDTSSSNMVITDNVRNQDWPNPHPNMNVDVCLVKTDMNGNEVWQKTYGGTGTDTGYAVIAVKDGFVIAGVTNLSGSNNYDLYLIKTDLDGNLVWDRTFDGYEFSDGKSIVAVDDGYVIAGTVFHNNNSDVYLLKTDLDGNFVWDATYGGNGAQKGDSIVKVNNEFAIAGDTLSSDGNDDRNSDVYLVMTGAGGSSPSTSSSASGFGLDCGSCCPLVVLLLLIMAAAAGYVYWKKQGNK